MVGSLMIISQILQSQRNRAHPQQRLLCTMSFLYLLVSLSWIFAIFLLPKQSIVYDEFEMDPMIFGTKTSCTIMGFVVQFGMSTLVLLNCFLALYYLLVIKYSFAVSCIKKMEPYVYIVSFTFGITTSIATLVLDAYDVASYATCWITPYRRDLQIGLYFAPLWFSLCLIIVTMSHVYCHVRMQEKRSLRFSFGPALMKKTRAVGMQCLLYVASPYFVALFPTVLSIAAQHHWNSTPKIWFVLCDTFVPIEGFLNALVYFRLRFIRTWKEHPEQTLFWVMGTIIKSTLCFCCCEQDETFDEVVAAVCNPTLDQKNDTSLTTLSNKDSSFTAPDDKLLNSNKWKRKACPCEEDATPNELLDISTFLETTKSARRASNCLFNIEEGILSSYEEEEAEEDSYLLQFQEETNVIVEEEEKVEISNIIMTNEQNCDGNSEKSQNYARVSDI